MRRVPRTANTLVIFNVDKVHNSPLAVRENWTVDECIKEIRRQVEEVEEVYFVYVVDSNNVFIGLNGDLTNTKSNPSGSIFRAEAEIRKPDFDTPRYASRFHDTRDAAPPVPPAVGILEEDGTFIIEEGVSTIYGIEE